VVASILVAGLLAALGVPAEAHALALATGAAAGAAGAAGALTIYFLARPLRAVSRLAQALSHGAEPVAASARAEAEGDDEVAELARAIDRVAGDQALAMDRLQRDKDLFERILDGMGEGVLVLDADERIVLANQALRTMARVTAEIQGLPLLEAIRSAALKEAVDTAREHHEPVVREIELGRPMPRKLLARVSLLAPVDDGGLPRPQRALPPPKPLGGEWMIAVFHDVTDLRRLETIRTDFVANVSHELRTPVTAISTAAETLLAGALSDPDEAAEFVGVIDRHSTRLRQLVDDLLDLAKLEAKSFRLVLGDLPVRPVLEHAIGLMEDPARRRRMTLTLAPGSEGLRARIDRRALEQVVTNLLDNAIKYAGEGARVTVSGRRRRRRDLAGAPRARLRALLPRRRRPLARARRDGPRALDREAPRRADGRHRRRGERARQGRALHPPRRRRRRPRRRAAPLRSPPELTRPDAARERSRHAPNAPPGRRAIHRERIRTTGSRALRSREILPR
jgi:two-component system phosphate regulon sensor histidine kinase PhoR